MKKILAILSIGSINSTFAMTTVDVDAHDYTCNKIKVTSSSTVAILQMNCTKAKVIMHELQSGPIMERIPMGGAAMTMVQHPSDDDENFMDKVEFYSDKGTYLVCYYKNDKFVKCKAKPTKTAKVTSSAETARKVNSSNVTASAAK